MKRILISILLLANLCSGSAFAWDRHPTETADHIPALSAQPMDAGALTDRDHTPAGDLGKGTYPDDHCGHGAAHLVGIFYEAPVKLLNIDHSYRAATTIPLAFLYLAPLQRPPIA